MDWNVLMVARFIGGLGIGGSSVLGPVHIAELAPAKWRGRMVGLFQINIVVGILLAYLSNYIITTQNLGAMQWRWEFGVAIVPSILFLVMLYGIPRSSRWLVYVQGAGNRAPTARNTVYVDRVRVGVGVRWWHCIHKTRLQLFQHGLTGACPLQTPASIVIKVVFHRVGNRYFLSEVWLAGESTGRVCVKSRREKQLQIAQSASATTNTELALNAPVR
jgi:MFS family permease